MNRIEQNERLRKEIVDLADIWDGKESGKYGQKLRTILERLHIDDIPEFYTDGSLDKIMKDVLDETK